MLIYCTFAFNSVTPPLTIITASEIEKVRIGKFTISASVLIRAALKKGLHCEFLPEKVIRLSNEQTSHFFKGSRLPSNNAVAAHLSRNKYFLRRLLKKEGLPIPRTITLRHPAAWQKVLDSSLQFPLVVKPISASHANGATLNITSAEELEQAVTRAFAYMRKNRTGNRVLVEEYFDGHDIRLMVVGDRVVSAITREPAYVVGDGKSTIRQLVHVFNEEWQSAIKYDLPQCPMPLDNEVTRRLSRKNLTLNSVLPAGQKTTIRWNANVSTGGRSKDVTDRVHPRIKQLAIQVARISNLEIGGVDFLCKDMSSSDVSEDNVCILEINDSPGFDVHHFPVEGIGRDVCSDILDHIFDADDSSQARSADHVEQLLQDLLIDVPMPAISVTLPRHKLKNSQPPK